MFDNPLIPYRLYGFGKTCKPGNFRCEFINFTEKGAFHFLEVHSASLVHFEYFKGSRLFDGFDGQQYPGQPVFGMFFPCNLGFGDQKVQNLAPGDGIRRHYPVLIEGRGTFPKIRGEFGLNVAESVEQLLGKRQRCHGPCRFSHQFTPGDRESVPVVEIFDDLESCCDITDVLRWRKLDIFLIQCR